MWCIFEEMKNFNDIFNDTNILSDFEKDEILNKITNIKDIVHLKEVLNNALTIIENILNDNINT